MRCIYCKKDEKQARFESREHVIPDAMGTFGAGDKTPTLINMVCDECNQKMGDELETPCIRTSYLELFRSGALGTLRYQDPRLKSKKIKKSAFLDIKVIHSSGIGDKLSLVLYTDNRTIDLQNSISFRCDDNDNWATYSLDYFANKESELVKLKKNREALKEIKNSLFFVYDSDESLGKMVKLLDAYGFKVELNKERNVIGDLSDINGQIQTEISGLFNDIFFRFIAKIAFNYFTKYVLQELPIDIYHDCIDGLRKYIRYGNKYNNFSVKPSNESRLQGQDSHVKYPNCFHLVCVEYKNDRFYAYVNLYNSIGYEFVLFDSPNIKIKEGYSIGHHFDFVHNNVCRLNNIGGLRRKGIYVCVKPPYPLPKLVIAKSEIVRPNILALLRFGK